MTSKHEKFVSSHMECPLCSAFLPVSPTVSFAYEYDTAVLIGVVSPGGPAVSYAKNKKKWLCHQRVRMLSSPHRFRTSVIFAFRYKNA